LAPGAREQPDIVFVCSGGGQLAFRDQSFDAVLLMDVIEHVADADKPSLVEEAYRVLLPRGLLILTTVQASAFAWLPGFLSRLLHGLGVLEERLSFGPASHYVRLTA